MLLIYHPPLCTNMEGARQVDVGMALELIFEASEAADAGNPATATSALNVCIAMFSDPPLEPFEAPGPETKWCSLEDMPVTCFPLHAAAEFGLLSTRFSLGFDHMCKFSYR
jgi:hypothetical protein